MDEALVVPGDYNGRSGYDGMKLLLHQAADVDAIFAISDVLPFGAMEALREAGRRIPEDVAVVGWEPIIVYQVGIFILSKTDITGFL